jgi:hypothetical protein
MIRAARQPPSWYCPLPVAQGLQAGFIFALQSFNNTSNISSLLLLSHIAEQLPISELVILHEKGTW